MSQKRRWSELSGWQRALVSLAGTVQVALLLAALRDLRRRSDDQINGSRRLWKAAVFVNYIGPILYFWRGRRSS